MSSESERKLSLEELKQLNRPKTMPPQPAPMPPAHPPQWEQAELLAGLERLEAGVSAQEALLLALTRQAGQLPSQAQLEVLARDVAQIRETLQQAGKKRGRRFSLPRLRLPYIPWSRLFLGLAALLLTGGVMWTAWFSLGKLWSAVRTLIP